jgi:putative ABC transport system permease protein
MFLASRNLLKDKTRLALSVGGVALAVMLILLLGGFLAGMNQQITSYLDYSPGSIVVAQDGVGNLLGATSLLPTDILERAESAQGVEDAVPILSQFVILELHDKKQPAYLIGYDPAEGGGPWEIAEGREPEADDEVIFDRVLADRHEIEIGDTFEIMGQDFTVVGLSDDTTSWMTSFFFMRKSAAERLLLAPGATSFLLVTVEDGVSAEAVRDELSEIEGTQALLKSEVAANDLKLFANVFSAPLRLMVGIAFLVGTMIVGLVIYTATVERQREYGVLKALGGRNGLLYRVVGAQALIVTALGSAAGVLAAYGAGALLMALRPQFLIVFDPVQTAQTSLIGLAMGLLAALFPARLLAGLAPAEVFRK